MKANKLSKILMERNISIYMLSEMLNKNRGKKVNLKHLREIIEGKKFITATLGKRPILPSLLQSLCEVLNVKAGDIIDY